MMEPLKEQPVGREPTRRQVLRVLGQIGAASVLGCTLDAVAGPFERKDFERLVPADKKLSAQWVAELRARGEPRVLRGKELAYVGMPVGGIGAGQLYLGGDGKLWRWDIFNAHLRTGAARYAHPDKTGLSIEQGFGLWVKAGDRTVSRRLDASGFPNVTFLGQYPVGTVGYADDGFAVSTELEAFSPFIPLNADDSSLPATVMRFTLTNRSQEVVEATLGGWLQNAVLINSGPPDARRRNRIVHGNGMSFLQCSAEPMTQDADSTKQPRPDIVVEDWNKEDYSGWKVEGTAFGSRPAKRSEIPAYIGDVGPVGDRFVNSHVTAPGRSIGEKDGQVGKLTSRAFTVERDFLSLWVGGGNHNRKTCVDVRIDGSVVESITGNNANRMTLHEVDLRPHQGKQATIEIVDAEKGAWGNIGVGPIVLTDRPIRKVMPQALPDFGTMGLALLGEPADIATARAAAGELPAEGADDALVPIDHKLIGMLGRTVQIKAGESAIVTFVLTWHFPNLTLDGLGQVGRYYASKFASAQPVAQYVSDHLERLMTQTIMFRDTWYDSSLPIWFLDRTLLNASILATSTCYRFADGRFYAWEGVVCCPGTCTHVWHYAHSMARLFPELERDTRERVDLKLAMNAGSGVIGFRAEFDPSMAVDGQAGTLLRCYREHQMSADDAFLRRNWQAIRKAYEPLLKLDGNDDGILEGAQMNTLDKPWFGKVAWLSGMYLASVRAGEAMARHVGETEFADRCGSIAERGAKNLVTQLFNGEYFANVVDQTKLDEINSGSGCEIDQVLGQSWAWQVGLARVLPREQTVSALKSLWKYNFTPDVGPYRQAYKAGRWYAMPGEAGLLMCTFPRPDWDYDQAKGKGPQWAAGYFDECMNGFEHQVAGHMIWEGLVTEGLAIERAIDQRYAPLRRNPWNEIECGDHYARSMASHGVYLAACGYEYDGPQGYLAMAPRLTPHDFKAAFTAAEGWGTYSQTVRQGAIQVLLALCWGRLRLKTLALTPEGATHEKVTITLAGKPVAGVARQDGQRVVVTFPEDVIIEAPKSLQVTLGGN